MLADARATEVRWSWHRPRANRIHAGELEVGQPIGWERDRKGPPFRTARPGALLISAPSAPPSEHLDVPGDEVDCKDRGTPLGPWPDASPRRRGRARPRDTMGSMATAPDRISSGCWTAVR